MSNGISTSQSESEAVLAEFELSRALALQWAVVGTLGFLISLGLFGWLYGTLTGDSTAFLVRTTGFGWWNQALSLLLFAALTTIIVLPHELLHGLAISYFGGTPRYGAGIAYFVLPYAYATTDTRFTRNQFIMIALAPLVGLTVIGVPLMVVFEWSWLVVPLAANAGGAVGDLWMVLTLLGYPSHVRVEDSTTGMRILGQKGDQSTGHSVTGFVWDSVVGAAIASVGLLVVTGLIVPLALPALGIESLTLGQPGTPSLIFEFKSGPRGYSSSVGFGVLVFGGVLGLAYSFVQSRWRQRTGTTSAPGDEKS
jgi:preprotein translocase subunit Sss1